MSQTPLTPTPTPEIMSRLDISLRITVSGLWREISNRKYFVDPWKLRRHVSFSRTFPRRHFAATTIPARLFLARLVHATTFTHRYVPVVVRYSTIWYDYLTIFLSHFTMLRTGHTRNKIRIFLFFLYIYKMGVLKVL